jgi:hypothetical protein
MAVSKKIFNICKDYFKKSSKIGELGSQFVVGDEWGGYGPPYFKNVFNHLDITSFDYNGENGAVKVNLSNPIDHQFKNIYDLITNFGTTEHVKNQYMCWKNIFEMVKEGGFVINEIPKKGSWSKHCKFYFDEETFNSLSNDFEVIEFKDIFYEGQGNLIYCVLKKIHSDAFLTKEDEFISKIEIDKDFEDTQGF